MTRPDPTDADTEMNEIADLANAVVVAALDSLEPAPAAPSTSLRSRVLTAALHTRAGTAPSPLDPRDVHRIEVARLDAFLAELTPDQWDTPVGPLTPAPDLGWTARDVVVHLAAMEGLLAETLGLGSPDGDEMDPLLRTEAAAARLARDTAAALAEMRRLATLVDDHLSHVDVGALDRNVSWVGPDVPLGAALLDRAFETWTHADDIRRAIGRPLAPPAPDALATMSTFAANLVPLMTLLDRTDVPANTIIDLRLTGPGGGDHRVAFSGFDDGRPSTASISADVVDFCQAVGARFEPGRSSFDYLAGGDTDLAARVVAAIPALARL